MSGVPLVVMFLSAGLVGLFGYLVRFRRMYWLINGYRRKSVADLQRQAIDIDALCRSSGNGMLVMSGILLVATLLLALRRDELALLVMALILPVVVWMVIATQRADGRTRTAGGTARPGAKILTGFIAISIVGIAALVGFLIFGATRPAAIAFEDNALVISGLYGQQIPAADMQRAELVDALPKVLRRTNGSAVGSQLAGHFTLEGIGAAMLYVKADQPPFIRIETATRKIYLNAGTPEATRALHEKIAAARQSG